MNRNDFNLQRRQFCINSGSIVAAAGIFTLVPVSFNAAIPDSMNSGVSHDPVFDYGPYYAEVIDYAVPLPVADTTAIDHDPQLFA